jgi:ABC-type lipoprotein export system ATPase subunit
LLPEFTALENVCIPGWIAGVQKKVGEKKHLNNLMDAMQNRNSALNQDKVLESLKINNI